MDTEEKILVAARAVFMQKGFAAARMQEIADEAQINKGLLHYYFRSKNRLFQAVFQEAFGKVILHINQVFETELPLFEKIEIFVTRYMQTLLDNPQLPVFVINELNQKGVDFIDELLDRGQRPNPLPLIMQIQAEVEAGNIRQVNPFHLVLSMLSMCVFPFIAQPLFQAFAQVNEQQYKQLLQNRAQEIIDLIIFSIRK